MNINRTKAARRMATALLATLTLVTAAAASAAAQQQAQRRAPARRLSNSRSSFSGGLYDEQSPAQTPQEEEEEEFIKPSRPTLADPAEFQKPGVLQVEYGYDGQFRSDEFRAQQTALLALRYAATRRLLLQLDLDTVKSETDAETRVRRTGLGDTRLGFQVLALEDNERHPALAFAYRVKLPSASEAKGLGTGRFDHRLMGLLSKKVNRTDFDFNAAFLVNGREGAPGWEHGGQAAFSVSHEFENRFGVQGELSGQSIEEAQPRGVYALGAVTYKVNRRLVFDGGLRFGLNPTAPRVGVVAGVTVGAADFRRR
ncbi:MAG TPA: transporter [Pyrinomonadaceae bacterium]|nr:transporter [Pyrinomonadaceae bacterium]